MDISHFLKFSLRTAALQVNLPRLSDGVMVAQGPLEAFVMVRIHVGQPILTGAFNGFIQFPPEKSYLSYGGYGSLVEFGTVTLPAAVVLQFFCTR